LGTVVLGLAPFIAVAIVVANPANVSVAAGLSFLAPIAALITGVLGLAGISSGERSGRWQVIAAMVTSVAVGAGAFALSVLIAILSPD
jgi:hypothetical protein